MRRLKWFYFSIVCFLPCVSNQKINHLQGSYFWMRTTRIKLYIHEHVRFLCHINFGGEHIQLYMNNRLVITSFFVESDIKPAIVTRFSKRWETPFTCCMLRTT